MNRRTFLKLGIGVTGTGLLLKVAYDNKYTILEKVMSLTENMNFDANAFIFIDESGKVKIICHRSEMGQGIRTALPMVMADELNVSWEDVEVVQADGDSKYGSQNTDGSKSIRDFFIPLRTGAAAAREMLVTAAALTWGVNAVDCKASLGKIVHTPSGRELSYGELVEKAKSLEVPKDPKLKKPEEYIYIGKEKPGYDLKAITQGQAVFGIDVELPQMKYAALMRAPIPGAKLKSVNDLKAKALAGVLQVVALEEQGPEVNANASVAVVATNTWAAFQGRDLLEAEWDYAGLKMESSHQYVDELKKSLTKDLKVFRAAGDIKKNKTGKVVKAAYHTPYLVHAPMEPLVATAHVTADGCEVWAPCQDPQRAMKCIAKLLNIDEKNVKFHITFLGGGFGRKSQPDFVCEAVLLSKKIGAPVKLQWSREDEVRHGFYHAESYQELEASLDANGMAKTWVHHTAFPTIMKTFLPIVKTPADWEIGMAASNVPYRLHNIEVAAGTVESSLRIGWLRSVCNLWHSFAVESFVDELAHAAKIDPVDYRVQLHQPTRIIKDNDYYPQDTNRTLQVIEKVKTEFGWDKPLPAGHGKGFASQYSFLSYVAMAIEVSVVGNTIKVERVVTCIDCGLAVNPDSVKAQMEGAVIFGLSAALHGKITVNEGRVVQSNYHDYPVVRMSESPKIEVHIINGKIDRPTGVGEPGVPPVAPALANAIFSATGKRLRELPLSLA